MDFIVRFFMTVVLIVGVYQFYFWTQNHMIKSPIEFKITRIDHWFKLKPAWVYIYSGLYYPVIVFVIFTTKDMRHFNYTAMNFFILLAIQMLFFRYFPVVTPDPWRQLPQTNQFSIRFLRFVQKYDQQSNCFPSMHVSVSVLTTLHLINNAPYLRPGIWLFPLLISISALYTKQHYFFDLIPGALLGWIVFQMFRWIY